MPARAASRSTASTKSRCSSSRMNVIASPLFWQPKQYQTPFSGLIENDGDFSVCNVHITVTLRPTRLSEMCSPASATRSVVSRTRCTSSARIPISRQVMARCRQSRGDSHAARQVFGSPAEELDAETQREPIGHAAHVAYDDGGGLRQSGREARVHTRGIDRQSCRRVKEEV